MDQHTSGMERDLGAVRLPSWGRVVPADGAVAFDVVGDDGCVVRPISEYLRDFKARGHRDGSVRSYAHVLLRWWRFLQAVGVGWDRATPAECRDFVLWFQQAKKPISARRTESATRGRHGQPGDPQAALD